MNITCDDIVRIKNAMGEHHDLILIEGETLTLYWWTNKGKHTMIVTDYNGHRSYFNPFIEKVREQANAFHKLYG